MTIQHWTCQQCGKDCERRAVRGKRPKFCGPSCYELSKQGQHGTCEQCGVEYFGYGVRFCSTACDKAYRVAHPQPKAKPKPAEQRPTPVDLRSDIRRAYESRDADAMLAALEARSTRMGDCLLWGGALKQGYPAMKVRDVMLHRAIVETTYNGELGSQPVHHLCANRSCVSPSHLVPVTHAENIAEMLARNAYLARIRELEAELFNLSPDHPLLAVIRVA